MDHQRWIKIEDVLQHALDLEPSERAAFLDQCCHNDQELRIEVESLLSREVEARSFMESPAAVFDAQETVPSPTLPSKISHYSIEAQIGAGGMGEVYKARDETLRRVVALKMLPTKFTSDTERVRRFEQEAFSASRLNHPSIITIFEITHDDGAHFIAEEFVDGQTLRELLNDPQTNQPRKLTVERALKIAIQIAGALKAAHTAWIIHRDIKPENVMVRADGLVKVLDFGIAKLEEGGPTEKAALGNENHVVNISGTLHVNVLRNQLTTPGMIMGTASYMSPEQARGEQLDARTDLFSLGILLYEMVTAERLFTAATRGEALAVVQHVNRNLPPSFRSAHVPKELQRIIRKTLKFDRDDRYSSASDLMVDLTKLKRRLENKTARRIIGSSALAVIASVALVVLAAFLSVHEVWEEKILRDGHTAAVRRAVFSPDGRLLVSGGEDNEIIVWDFPTRQRLRTFTDHSSVVNAVAFSPDGKWFATGGEDHNVIVWDATRLQKVTVLSELRGPVRSLTFSPYGHLLAASSASEPEGLTIIWETDSWKESTTLPFGISYGNHIFLANNRSLADNFGRVWDLKTRGLQDEHADWKGNWTAVSPDGTRWASVDSKGNVKFADMQQERLLASQHIHHDHGRSVDFSPDGRWLATAAERIVLWDATTLTRFVPLEYDSIVWSVDFSPDGRWLVSAHGDGSVLAWDVAKRELVANLREHSGGVRAVAVSPDGHRIATASEDQSVIVWDLRSGHKEAVLLGHRTRITAVAFSSDGQWLGSTDQDGLTIRWDVANRVPASMIRPADVVSGYCLAISPDGRDVATSFAVYDIETGRALIPADVWSQVYAATFSSNGERLIGVTLDGMVLVVDTKTWQVIERQQWSKTALVSLSLSRDGQYLVTGEDGKIVRMGTVSPLRQIAVIGQHEARIKGVAFSPDGTQVASVGDDKMIALWDVNRRKLITRIGTHTSPIYAIAFSPDGRRLISGEHDRSVRIYTRHREVWGFRLE